MEVDRFLAIPRIETARNLSTSISIWALQTVLDVLSKGPDLGALLPVLQRFVDRRVPRNVEN